MKNLISKIKSSKPRVLLASFAMAILVFSTITFMFTYSQLKDTVINTTNTSGSGVIDNVVYMNDLEADFYYYNGLNYTYSANGTLPSGANQNLYNDTNLVQATITYSGVDLANNLTGYISNTEFQDTFVYYKVLPINNNGTSSTADDFVEIELIDNPFTNRPTDKGFNGWYVEDNSATMLLNYDYYTRYARIPITYTGTKPDEIEVIFHASWAPAKTGIMNGNATWASAFADFNEFGMYELEVYGTLYGDVDMTGYYFRVNLSRGDSCTGMYSSDGTYQRSCTCNAWWGGCTYYTQIANENYDEGNTYYELRNGSMQVVTNIERPNLGTQYLNGFAEGYNMAGYYRMVTLSRNQSIVGYYSNLGVYQESGTCTSTTCTYYELIPYVDAEGNPSTLDVNETYYYLSTRDTNIILLNGDVNTTWSTSETEPFTLTSVYNGIDYRSTVAWTVSNRAVVCNDDTVIENIKIIGGSNANTNPSSSNNGTGTLFARWHNVKLGRGITRNNTNVSFLSVIAGYNESVGSSTNLEEYKLVIESGFYNSFSMLQGASRNSSNNHYVDGLGVYGNDYDRATGNNDNLLMHYCASGGWSGNLRSSSTTRVAISVTVKSGQFGTGRLDETAGIYIGGRFGGTHYAIREAKIEGGWIYNLIGGPLSATNRSDLNDIHAFVTGGEIDMITGGGATTATYGNRLIQVTGGTINYSVFGGSNGYDGNEGEGTINGSSFLYIGGNATIGSATNVNNNSTMWNAEAGSVFGIGNGRSGYSTIGSNRNSNIIIADEAVINRNVYGGGNYGATGASSSLSTTSTNIHIIGGTVRGSVYGGGNNNGSGATNRLSTINITMDDGIIEGSIYGGSNQLGTIYGSTNVHINGGTVMTSVYGGGQGGYRSTSSTGTFVSQNVNVVVGTATTIPNIYGNVYGGSAFGTVNGTSRNPSLSSYTTNVTVDNGVISGSVFGGGEGNATYTPYVGGNITVEINDGTIENVFGGNDAAGTPTGTVVVNLEGGTVNNVYGGGNETSLTTSNVYLRGGNITNIFGGSNQSGTVTTSNITTTGGNAGTIYGGNNVGGSTTTSRLYINGATIGTVYGGGRLATTNLTNIELNGATITNVYGGGESANITTSTNITLQGSDVTNIYGGSNTSGTVPITYITTTSGNAGTIYGGNNAGGSTTTSEITINGANITDIYGGGNEANTTTSNVTVNTTGSEISNIYGGGRQANVPTTNINIHGGLVGTIFGGSNTSGTVNTSNVILDGSPTVGTIYGGNNAGGTTGTANVTITSGTVSYVYGGGNEAVTNDPIVRITNATILQDVYGGGNRAGITNGTDVDIINATVEGNIFGGGNAATVGANTDVYVSSSTVHNSIYAGGNGALAVVRGNTLLNVDGTTTVTNHVFGGGNAAATGSVYTNVSTGVVNIAGATIGGNVYGGANTSVLYGTVELNIGSALVDSSLISGDIHITGTVFGGGEANASGDDNYDYSFISVTNGILINIDGSQNNLTITGSIFGSGNASSTTGYSYINLTNYGTLENYQKNISIQRANIVTMDNSYIELSGATDRTNEYSTTLFTISRVDEFKLKNNSMIFLQTGANLLQKLSSLVDVNGVEQKATVTIDDSGNTTKNVDNRVYIYEGKNLNIATNESVTSYGEVYGMSFFGMYVNDRDGRISEAYFDPKYNNGDTVDVGDFYAFSSGSYVLGRHNTNHNIKVDGFYTNSENEDVPGTILVKYIQPTPDDSNFYMWTIGETVSSYDIDLVASKYSTLGTYELPLINSPEANTTFSIVGFTYFDVGSDFELIDENEIPRIAQGNEADTKMGLAMTTTNQGWITVGRTDFLTNDETPFKGTIEYVADNSSTVPSLLFYLYHSKNLKEDGDIGTVTISLVSITPITDLESEVQRVNININLSKALYNTNNYEAAMTVGEEYGLFASTAVDMTNTSKLSAYYSLYAESEESIYKDGYHRTLVSSFVLPVNTKITMVDLNNESPEYYYYVVTQEDYDAALLEFQTMGDASYNISKFVRMGSSSVDNHYDDAQANIDCYHASEHYAHEEFVFIVDFEESGINETMMENTLLFELRDADNQVLINVLGVQHLNMTYNLYEGMDAVIDVSASLSESTIYIGHSTTLTVDTNFVQQVVASKTVYDTHFFRQNAGLKLSIFDSNGNEVTGSSLLGITLTYDGVVYHPRVDGSVRINIAERVANISSRIVIDTTNANLASDVYTIQIESFGSPDGIYYGLVASDSTTIDLRMINSIYGLDMELHDDTVLFDKTTGLNEYGNNAVTFTLRYSSGLANPNLRVSMYRRKYDTIQSTDYEIVNLEDYVTTSLRNQEAFEYMVADPPSDNLIIFFYLKDNLKSGTYKFVFTLYDENTPIGDVSEYIIIK